MILIIYYLRTLHIGYNRREVDLFHGDLTRERNLLLTKWKTWKTGVNLIIYFNFPLSFVKENERVCRDGTKAKGVIFYSKGELKFLYRIILEKREYIGYEETLEIHTKQIIY